MNTFQAVIAKLIIILMYGIIILFSYNFPPYIKNKIYTVILIQQEINKRSVEPSHLDAKGHIWVTHYKDQIILRNIIIKSKPDVIFFQSSMTWGHYWYMENISIYFTSNYLNLLQYDGKNNYRRCRIHNNDYYKLKDLHMKIIDTKK